MRVDPARIPGSPAGAQRFDYYRAEVFRVSLNHASTRFRGEVGHPRVGAREHRRDGPRHARPDGRRGLRHGPRIAPLRAPGHPLLRRGGRRDRRRQRRAPGRARDPRAGWTGTRRATSSRRAACRCSGPPTRPDSCRRPPCATGNPAAPGLVAVSADASRGLTRPPPRRFGCRPTAPPAASVALPGAARCACGGRRGCSPSPCGPGRAWCCCACDEPPVPGPCGCGPVRGPRAWRSAAAPSPWPTAGGCWRRGGARCGAWRRPGGRWTPWASTTASVAWVERGTRRGARVGVIRLGRAR